MMYEWTVLLLESNGHTGQMKRSHGREGLCWIIWQYIQEQRVPEHNVIKLNWLLLPEIAGYAYP